MRRAALALLLLAPAALPAQTPEIDAAIKAKLESIRYVLKLEGPAGGFAPAVGAKPGLRATSACVRTLKYHGHKLPHPELHAAFVLDCFDPTTGGFADTLGAAVKGETDVTLTSVGVMAAVELGIPREKYRKALDYLHARAKTFEEVRIAAAAAEAWGLKDYPHDLAPWRDVGARQFLAVPPDEKDGGAREVGSVAALVLRLGGEVQGGERAKVADLLALGQRADGGWGKKGAAGSDLETTYRVMRAVALLRGRPVDAAKLRTFVAACRNADGGSGVEPGTPSGAGPTYYAAIVLHWLGERERN